MTHRTPVRAAALASALMAGAVTAAEPATASHPYVGLWVTDDGHVRHALLPNGRYDEARGRVVYEPVAIEPRTLVPRVIREDNRYEAALKDAPRKDVGHG